mgnify:CR=1 FL=1
MSQLDGDEGKAKVAATWLLTSPGVPFVYYGEEVGMRGAKPDPRIRTPMQWTSDRNGGFSRADPARLYLPVIMDPVYGYQAVNVEAQSRTTSSLLHWTRRMLQLRREMEKLERSLGGIKNMNGLPDALFLIDVGHEKIALAEANKLGIPVVAVVDTNCSPAGVDYVVPGNDDAMRAIQLYSAGVADAVLEGRAQVPEVPEGVDEFVEVINQGETLDIRWHEDRIQAYDHAVPAVFPHHLDYPPVGNLLLSLGHPGEADVREVLHPLEV